MENKKLFHIGFIKNTHGLKGFFEIKLNNNIDLLKFINKNIFILSEDNIFIPYLIENVAIKKNNFIIKISNFNSINDISKFIKHKLYISIKDMEKMNINIKKDIVGFNVINYKNNQKIGIIDYVNRSTKNIFFSFKNIENNKDMLIPLIDKFIFKIDYETKNVFVKLIKGL